MSLLDELHCDVAIIGAGFSGTMVAVHLLNEPQSGLTVALIEKNGRYGRGVAYGTANPLHLLNVPAAKMSAFPEAPDHFLHWLQAHPKSCQRVGLAEPASGTFAPRMLYGEYVESLLKSARSQRERLFHLRSEATDVEPLMDGSLRIRLANGTKVHADRVVLALGNFPPGDPPLRDRHFHDSPAYLKSPWSAGSQEKCAEDGDILILGSGLTTLDLLVSLHEDKRHGTVHVLSRRGLFPQPHRAGVKPVDPFVERGNLPVSIRALVRQLRVEVARTTAAGGDWRAVVDSLRPFTQELWKGLSLEERRRFFRHLRPYWEAHRHRAAPAILAVKESMERAGRLQAHRGRLQQIVETVGGGLQVTFQAHGSRELRQLSVRQVVNCTGPECNYHRLGEPLVLQLFARGLIRPDAMMLGLDADDDGVVQNRRGIFGQVFTLGSSRKGALFETTAVPELRVQARALAGRLLERFSAEQRGRDWAPDPAYAYKIKAASAGATCAADVAPAAGKGCGQSG
ncbi:MAG: FAD-dependent oxidoreductase [Chthoniobacteraceae bacterium]